MRILYFICLISLGLLTSCDEDVTRISIGGSNFKTTINNIEIEVKPISIKKGEEIIISATHKTNKNISIELSSESLGYEETITTPDTIRKMIDIEGIHDLNITYKSGIISSSTTTFINVTK